MLIKKRFNRISVVLLAIMMLIQVIVPLASVTAAADYALASDRAYTWLKAQQDLTIGMAGDGMVDSFDDWWDATNRKQIAYTYDQAVAAIAFMLKGDRVRAEKVLTKMSQFQDADGSWINSYWWNNGYGEEIRKHVGPVAWMVMAYMTYEKKYGDLRFQPNVKKALDWAVTFQKANGGISGGRTQWDVPNTWTDEVWTSTEHNEDMYNVLKYYANVFQDRTTIYNNAADGVKNFLDNVVWNDSLKRWNGGWKNNTNLIDPNVPLDVNPWGVLSMGLTGTRDYKQSLAFVDNANGTGTVADPKYVHTLDYDGTNMMTAYDFDWEYDCAEAVTPTGQPNGNKCADIWFEGSAFMSTAHYMNGNTAKANAILDELIKKQGTSGTLLGGLPYSLKGSNNNYWKMSQENCVSSTGWLIIAIARYNPFTGESLTATSSGGAVIPGKIEAESYSNMFDVQTEATTDTGGGLNVGWINTGSWMDYSVNVQNAGNYTVGFRIASPNATGQLQLKNASGQVLTTANIPNTGGWQSWQTVNASVNLPAGNQTLRLYASAGGFNINWLDFTTGGSSSIYSIPASSIPAPTGSGVISLKVMNGTNGAYQDNQIYWGVIGINPSNGKWSYLDVGGNLQPISLALNDAPGHLTKNGVNYANFYHKISDASWVSMPRITSGRMFLCVGTECYIKTYDNGFAGPNIENPTDPNVDVYFDFIEFTVDAAGYHGNTTRVDMFGFPIQHRLVNTAGNYDKTVGELEAETRSGLFVKFANEMPSPFKSLGTVQAPYRIIAPIHGSFAAGGANKNYFSGYSSYSTQDILRCDGALANAQTCAAINRHVFTDSNWNNVGNYYQAAPANYYSKFWHAYGINGLAYGFPYDDVNNQAAYLEIGNPKGLIVRVGW
ncbi:beta-1,3-glucanase family protein [Paenibacillus guangzhouensis]|uniref:beta-1,3-glucanase family protein n=1 Tax=Paenibacillus guangzhouensis TaxID=1473112 RepID=UPI002AB0BBBC|nr:beta-1,3-glucanase family protein [Paenibacillus guangzhouensis]